MDDRRRIVMIETLTVDGGSTVTTPVPRQRFQLGNHLDSAALEVDEDGALITYEEYHPYGTTSWWASNGSTDVGQKRYRYTGKEKDEETALAYHGARYCCSWIGRWERPDPSGLRDGVNRFSYARNNPVRYSDTTGNASEESWSVSGFFSAWGDAAEGGAKAFGAAVKANVGDPMERAIKDPIGTASGIASATPLAEAIRVGSDQGVVAGYLAGTQQGLGMAGGAAYEFGASVARSPLAPLRAYQAGQEIKAGVAAGDPARAQAGVEGIGRALNDTANAGGVITGALGAVSAAGRLRSAVGALDIAGVGPVVDKAITVGAREGTEALVPRFATDVPAAATSTTVGLRGTTYYAAMEVVEGQSINVAEMVSRQAGYGYPGDRMGLYLTSQEATAQYFADLLGAGGRAGGGAILGAEVPTSTWTRLVQKYGLKVDAAMPDSPLPGMTETLLPPEAALEFDQAARYFIKD